MSEGERREIVVNCKAPPFDDVQYLSRFFSAPLSTEPTRFPEFSGAKIVSEGVQFGFILHALNELLRCNAKSCNDANQLVADIGEFLDASFISFKQQVWSRSVERRAILFCGKEAAVIVVDDDVKKRVNLSLRYIALQKIGFVKGCGTEIAPRH